MLHLFAVVAYSVFDHCHIALCELSISGGNQRSCQRHLESRGMLSAGTADTHAPFLLHCHPKHCCYLELSDDHGMFPM